MLVKDNSYDLLNANEMNRRRGNNKENSITPTQEVRIIDHVLNEGSAMETERLLEAAAVVPAANMTQKTPRYPTYSQLMLQYPDAVKQILKAVDDCGATSETQASDKTLPKGNKWAAVLDVCHGGGSKGRGSMAKYGWQAIAKATAYKKKILQMWDFGLKNEEKVLDLYETCKRQHAEHAKACSDEKDNSNKQRAEAQKQQQAMEAYQQSIGARPPGARASGIPMPPDAVGRSGGGRGQHSTSLNFGQPATFGYDHHRSSNGEQNISPLTNNSSNNSNNSNTTYPRKAYSN